MSNYKCLKKARSHCWKALLALAINILITRISVSDCTNPAYDQQAMNEIDLPDAADAKLKQNHDPILFTTIGQEHLPLTEKVGKRFRPEIAVLNVGRGFKPSIGYFVAPRDGVYLFNFVGLAYNLPTGVIHNWINLRPVGHPEEHDSSVIWSFTDPITSAGHSLVSMKKDDVMEYWGRMDSYCTNYLDGLNFVHNNWWRLSGRWVADIQFIILVPYHPGMLLNFTEVYLNAGNGFNSSSATFVAPTSGLYHFFLHFSTYGRLHGEARIEKADLLLAAGSFGKFDNMITMDIDAISKLQKGESVFVKMLGNFEGHAKLFKFSG
ncbi:unnamed protein product, partial [Notodromas monacha]